MPRSLSAAALEQLHSDPAMRLLAPLAQFAWVKLVAAMHRAGLSVLRLGPSRVPAGSEVAAFAGLAESEWEAHAPALIELGLLTVEEDGAISVPVLTPRPPRREVDRRAAASRQNGCKGGRPRKNPDPSQREIMLPITGGRDMASADAEPAGAETCQVSQVSPAVAKLESSSLETKLVS